MSFDNKSKSDSLSQSLSTGAEIHMLDTSYAPDPFGELSAEQDVTQKLTAVLFLLLQKEEKAMMEIVCRFVKSVLLSMDFSRSKMWI